MMGGYVYLYVHLYMRQSKAGHAQNTRQTIAIYLVIPIYYDYDNR